MKIVEIIHVRLAAENLQSLGESIRRSVNTRSNGEVFTVYQRCNLESDLAIHIHRKDDDEKEGASRLGLHLAAALKAYGMVEHTIWKEMRPAASIEK